MFVDTSAIVALLSDEPEAERVSKALAAATKRITSPIAVLEAALALGRPDKFGLSVEVTQSIVLEFLEARGIDIRDLPPPKRTIALALSAAHRYRAGCQGLNFGDCLHYASAKYHRVPMLAIADEFRQTDLEVVR